VSTSSELVQRQLDAYNRQDIEAFLECYTEDAVLGGLNGDITQAGVEEIRARHLELFAQFPENKATIVNEMDLGSTVILHEDVTRAPGGDQFQVAAIYTIRDDKIARVDFARGTA
jgi:uncharacterized protein (TIGR02246 family)